MTEIFIKYFGILFATLLILLALGHTGLWIAKVYIEDFYTRLFANLVLGSTLLVMITSIIYTKGVTINTTYIVLFFCYFAFFKKRNDIKKSFFYYEKNNKITKDLLLFIVVATVIFSIKWFSIYAPALFLVPHGDIVFYANLADFIQEFGKENSSVDYVIASNSGVSPYHYFEIWLNIGISSIFNTNSAKTFILVNFSLATTILWFGFRALCSSLSIKNFWLVLFLSTTGVLFSGVTLELYTKIAFMQNIDVFARNVLNYPKLYPVYLFVLSAFLAFIKKQKDISLLCLLCTPIASISTALPILSSVFVFLVIDKFFKKQYSSKLIFITGSIGLYLFLFYTVFNEVQSTHVSTSSENLLSNLKSLAYLKTCFNIVAGTSIQILLIFIPFILIFLTLNHSILNPKKYPFEILLMTLIYVSSLCGWAILHNKLSSVQVFSNISVVMLNIAFFIITASILASKYTLKKHILSLTMFSLCMAVAFKNSFNEYKYQYPQSKEYIEKVYAKSADLTRLGGFLFSKEDYKQIGFSYVANFVILGDYLIYSQEKTFPISLSPHQIEIPEEPIQKQMWLDGKLNTPFYLYVEKQKGAGNFKSIAQSQIDFIREFKINYLIVTKNVRLTPELQNIVKEEIVDSNTGERFILLK